MTQTVTTEVAKQQERKTPGQLVKAYSQDFATVLPSHIKPETWVRVAQGALKKGKPFKVNGRETGRTELEEAAQNNPGVFLAALLDAARLGLEPGTEQYYLTPRRVKGRLEILGIPGYQGYVELMYRAGAISSVVCEVVYTEDTFSFQPGRDEVPQHEIDWDAEDRGQLRLTYAYARMKDGAVSRVVVLNRKDIERIKKSSQGSDSEYSPWVNHEAAMWLKSSVRQLAKWVPTSAEYIREQLRAVADVRAEQEGRADRRPAPSIQDVDPEQDYIDGEVVHDTTPADEPTAPTEDADLITDAQLKKLHTLLTKCAVPADQKHRDVSTLAGRVIESTKDLTKDEAVTVIDKLEDCARGEQPALELEQVLDELRRADAEQGGES